MQKYIERGFHYQYPQGPGPYIIINQITGPGGGGGGGVPGEVGEIPR